ncbi:hypothetical protein [Endothiovibrio diazotrophicus]
MAGAGKRVPGALHRQVRGLIEGLGISAYLFTLEERPASWRLTLEYAICSGWYKGEVELAKGRLAQAAEDEDEARALGAWLREQLPSCPPPSTPP